MTQQNINLGNVDQGNGDPLRVAFAKVNDNFTELYNRLIDLSVVNQSIIPDVDQVYDLGSATNRWRDLYLSGSSVDLGGTTLSVVDGDLQLGGVKIPTQTDLDNAIVDIVSGSIDLTPYATVTALADKADLSYVNDIQIAVNADLALKLNTADLPAIPTDVSDLTDTEGLLVHTSLTGYATEEYVNNAIPDVSNFITAEDIPAIPADVSDLTDNTNLLGGGSSFDQTLNTTDDVTFSNLTSTGVVAGVVGGINDTPLNIETYATDGESTVVNSWLFGTDGNLTLPNGAVIKDNADSSVSFGGGAGATNQGAGAVAIGEGAGNNTQSNQAVAIGRGSGNYQQGVGAVGVGFCAGATEQGDYAVAIGFKAARGNMDNDGTPNQPANSIMINASSTPLNGNQAGLYINPVREDTGNTAKAVYYNTTTKELTYANPTGGGGGDSLLSDNADITITIENAVTPENTLTWTFATDGLLDLPSGGVIGDIFDSGMTGIQADPTDPNAYASLVSGDKQQAVDATNDEVIIWADDDAQGGTLTKQWKFNRAGELTVPGFIHLQYSGVTQGSIGTGPSGFSLVGEEDKTFGILLAPAGSPPVEWTYSTDGGLTFPDSTVQTTAWPGGTSLSLNEIIVPDEQPFYIRTSEGTPLETALTISALGRIYLPSSTDYSLPVRSILTANDSLQINAGAVSYYLGSNGTVSLPGDALYYEPGIDFSIKTATTAADPSPQIWVIENEGTSDTPVFSISQATVGEGNVFLTWVDPTRPGTVQVKGPGILDGDTFVNVITLDPYGDPYTATIGAENGVFTNGEFYTFQFTEQQVDFVRQWTFDTDGQLRLPSGVGNIMFADNTVQETAAPYSVLATAGYSVDIEDNVDLTGDGGNGADAFQTVVNFGPDEQNIELFSINTVGVGTIGGSTGGSSVYTVVLSQGTSSVTLQGWAITPTDFATQQDPEGATFHYLGELIDITGDQYQFSQVILDTSFPAGTVLRLFNPNGTLYDVPEAGMTIRWADDTETAVIGVLINGQYIYSSNPQVTFITAEDQSTLPFPITIRTNDFQDGSKTFTIDQDIGFSLESIDNIANIESDTGLNVRVGSGSAIEFNVNDGAQDNVVRINEDGTVYVSNGIVTDGDVAVGGTFRPQAAVIAPPVTVMPGSTARPNDMQLEVTAIDGEGRVTAMTVLNSPNIEWAAFGGTGAILGSDINISVPVDGSGNAVVTVNSSGTGHTLGETYTIPAAELGAVSGQVFAPIPLNSSQVQILTAELGATGLYSLADGEEGQIMYFVPGTGINSTVYVRIDNARIYDGANPVNEVGYSWTPFHGETNAPTTIAMAIFADGAWCLRGGQTD